MPSILETTCGACGTDLSREERNSGTQVEGLGTLCCECEYEWEDWGSDLD